MLGPILGHNGIVLGDVMTFHSCFDHDGQVIARCQTIEEIEVLRRMGRPIAKVREMRTEEAVICSLTGSPAEFDYDQ